MEEDEKEILATQEETRAHHDIWPSLQGVADLDISEDQRPRAAGKQLANAN